MSADQIVTAELLANLTKCPFCGANQTRIQFGDWATYACLSSLHVEQKASRCRSILCEQRELATLRARVKELEEALNQIANQDYRGNRSVESQIAYAALKKGTKP